MPGGPGEPQRAAGEYDVIRQGDNNRFTKIADAPAGDRTFILNMLSPFAEINIVDLATGGPGVITGLQIASLSPGTDFECDTLSITNSQMPTLDINMKAWESTIRDNVASGNSHVLNVKDFEDVFNITRPVVPLNAIRLGSITVSGDYDKVELNFSTSETVGRINISGLGVREGAVGIVDAHCGSLIVTDNLIGSGTGTGFGDLKDFKAIIDIDSTGTHVLTGNVESDIKIR